MNPLPPADALYGFSGPEDAALAQLLERARALGLGTQRVAAGELLIREGGKNESLYILLEGEAQLSKRAADGGRIPVDRLGPGSLLGILSFWTGEPSFADCHAHSALHCLRLDRPTFERGVAEDPEFARLTQHLFVANLSERYRRVVNLNLRVAGLTHELQEERNALRAAVDDLEKTRNQLVHREKLASMGQLLAGIAHEINNPSSSLLKSVEFLSQEMPALFSDDEESQSLLLSGLWAPYLSTQETRDRMDALAAAHPRLGRSMCRSLARVPDAALDLLRPFFGESARPALERRLRVFEIGAALRAIQVADDRITRLVKSLKAYSRQDQATSEEVSLQDCVRDTLVVLNHRLKHYELRLTLGELPKIHCRPGEINQILTNLLTNACEATEPGKAIEIRTGSGEDKVWLEVRDEGHGIPDDLLPRIFAPNVTTKSGGGNYGLGLGLAISRDLALQHHGTLTARNADGGGAVFRLELPLG